MARRRTERDASLARTLTRHRRTRRLVLATPVVLGLVALLAWETVSRTGLVPPFFLPAPTDVAARLWLELSEGGLVGYTLVTLVEALLGSALGAVIAFPLGYLVARNRWAAAGLQPYIAASQALPAVALAPLLVIWVGYGLFPVVLLCALLVFFPILLATILGMRTLDQELIDAARMDGASGLAMLRHIEVPLAMPSLLTGLRNGFTLSVTGAVVGEFVMGGEGLGLVLSVQSDSADTTGLFSTLVVLAVLAVGMYSLLRLVERLTSPDRLPRRSRTRAGARPAGPVADGSTSTPAPLPSSPAGATSAPDDVTHERDRPTSAPDDVTHERDRPTSAPDDVAPAPTPAAAHVAPASDAQPATQDGATRPSPPRTPPRGSTP
ncbi:ABC transporter permease [Georgenia wangjunii]|uniref:ABC transporter permease n=1 Tax=Georgenia wangjunii TaxID=3117730 RepID=UPI002F260CA6